MTVARSREWLALALLALAGAACSQPARLQESTAAPSAGSVSAATSETTPSVYGQVRRSADGIGKTYQGREISAVMGWQGAAWLEREEREREERGSLLLRELALRPGMDVGDVGAGTGYYARRIAPLVGPQGRVYAVDVQPQMVAMLEQAAARPGLENLVPVQAKVRDPKLAPESIDLALMVDVYHELEYPHEVLGHLVRALRPGGRLVFVEYRAEDAGVPIKPLHKMSQAQIKREAALHALEWERTADTLPWQHVVVFRKR
jgi:precorrin-6B methylase 2